MQLFCVEEDQPVLFYRSHGQAFGTARLMDDFISYINTLSTSTWFIIGSLVVVAGMIMQQIVDSRVMTALFMLAFQGGAIGLNYLSSKYSVTPLAQPETNLIALSTVGMIIALFVALMTMRVVNAAADASRPKIERPQQRV
jgi:hypothetical protein